MSRTPKISWLRSNGWTDRVEVLEEDARYCVFSMNIVAGYNVSHFRIGMLLFGARRWHGRWWAPQHVVDAYGSQIRPLDGNERNNRSDRRRAAYLANEHGPAFNEAQEAAKLLGGEESARGILRYPPIDPPPIDPVAEDEPT